MSISRILQGHQYFSIQFLSKLPLSLEYQRIGSIADRTSVVLLLAIILLSTYSYLSTPSVIPVLFNNDGSAKAYGANWIFFSFPFIALLIFIVIKWLIRFLFEKPSLTRSNKLINLAQLSALFMKIVKLIVLLILLCIVFALMLNGQGFQFLFGRVFKIIVGVLISIPVVGYIYAVRNI